MCAADVSNVSNHVCTPTSELSQVRFPSNVSPTR